MLCSFLSSAILRSRIFNQHKLLRSLASKSKVTLSMSRHPTGKQKVVVLAGATSAGKSAAAMELVRLLGYRAEIIIADSVQV